MPSPTEEQLSSPEFEAIWSVIKSWDVNVPEFYENYCHADGSHVALILNALNPGAKYPDHPSGGEAMSHIHDFKQRPLAGTGAIARAMFPGGEQITCKAFHCKCGAELVRANTFSDNRERHALLSPSEEDRIQRSQPDYGTGEKPECEARCECDHRRDQHGPFRNSATAFSADEDGSCLNCGGFGRPGENCDKWAAGATPAAKCTCTQYLLPDDCPVHGRGEKPGTPEPRPMDAAIAALAESLGGVCVSKPGWTGYEQMKPRLGLAVIAVLDAVVNKPRGEKPVEGGGWLNDETVREITKQIVEGSDGEVISLPYAVVRDVLESCLGRPVESGPFKDIGLRLESWRISPPCQSRGLDVAWEDAVERLKQVYDAQLARHEKPITLTVAIYIQQGDHHA